MSLSQEKVWTYEDYCALPDDGNRYEVINGRLYMSPSPNPYHQRLAGRLFLLLSALPEGEVFTAPVDVLFPGATPVIPDLLYLRKDQADLVTRRGIEGVPYLVAEVLSPSTAGYDRTVKLNKYASAGVEHYWIVDPASRTLMLLELDGATYRLAASLGSEDRCEPPAFPGVVLDMPALFEGIPEVK